MSLSALRSKIMCTIDRRIEFECENSVDDSCRGFGNRKNFPKVGASNFDK